MKDMTYFCVCAGGIVGEIDVFGHIHDHHYPLCVFRPHCMRRSPSLLLAPSPSPSFMQIVQIGRALRGLTPRAERIIYEDTPDVRSIKELVLDVFAARFDRDHELEEELCVKALS